MASESGNINVLADAQFSVVKTLRPYVNFETDYEGTPCTRPIQVTEVLNGTGGEPRDDQAIALTPGYDPNLVRGLKVPMGARVVIFLPRFTPDNVVAGGADLRYDWLIEWRLRNVFDFRTQRVPFHHPKQSLGFPDTSSGTSEPRVVIPAASQTSVYVGAEPTGGGPPQAQGAVTQNARQEFISSGALGNALPFMPGGVLFGSIQQGLSNPGAPAIGPFALPSFYQIIETQAAGDELILSLRRKDTEQGAAPNWEFGQNPSRVDRFVSVFLGLGDTFNGEGPFRDIGVMVAWGTAP